MTELSEHLNRVERYGWNRDAFPVQVNGHFVYLLNNDAHFKQDRRMYFDIKLHCDRCDLSENMSGRMPVEFESQAQKIVNVKVASIAPFISEDCNP